jgi:hypothetical protein
MLSSFFVARVAVLLNQTWASGPSGWRRVVAVEGAMNA